MASSNCNNRRARQGDIDGARGTASRIWELGFSGTSRSAIDQHCPVVTGRCGPGSKAAAPRHAGRANTSQ